MNKKSIVWIVVIVLLLAGLFAWPKLNNPYRAQIASWAENGIDCLEGHSRAALHIHPHLTITADGVNETIPANTGIVRGCMAEIHMHDASGTIHIESARAVKEFTLGQFLVVYQHPFVREGFEAALKVDNATSTEGEHLILRDKQDIVLAYTSIDTATTTSQ